MVWFIYYLLQPSTAVHVDTPNTLHIEMNVIYYVVATLILVGTVIWRIYALFENAKKHSDANLVLAKAYGDKLKDDAVAERKVWQAQHQVDHERLISDQRIGTNEIQNEIDALAEKHDSDMHAFRKTIEAVLLEKRDLEAMMRQVREELNALNTKVEKISDTQIGMSTNIAQITERLNIIKSEHGVFHKGE